jgi:hypothetical protein
VAKIVVVTECPRFSDAGTHQRCELISDDKSWVFYIPWHLSQQAMPACGEVLAEHLLKPSNVSPINGARKGPPRTHG